MHTHSLEAYRQIADSLPQSRARVYRCIVKHPLLSRQRIAQKMGLPINSVTGRVKELLDAELIRESGYEWNGTKKRALLEAVRQC